MFAIDALVIQSRKYGENDVILTLLSAQKGKMYVCAKGGRSNKSEQLSLSQLFTYGNMEIYERNKRFWLKGGSVIRSFYGLSEHLDSLACAAYLAESVLDFCAEDVPAEEELQLLLNMLYAMDKGLKKPEMIKAVWEFRLSCIAGYAPDLDGCAICGKEDVSLLDIQNGHLLCADCAEKQNRLLPTMDERPEGRSVSPIRKNVLGTLLFIRDAEPKRLLSFQMNELEDCSNLFYITEQYFLYHVGHGFSTLDFYKSIR